MLQCEHDELTQQTATIGRKLYKMLPNVTMLKNVAQQKVKLQCGCTIK